MSKTEVVFLLHPPVTALIITAFLISQVQRKNLPESPLTLLLLSLITLPKHTLWSFPMKCTKYSPRFDYFSSLLHSRSSHHLFLPGLLYPLPKLFPLSTPAFFWTVIIRTARMTQLKTKVRSCYSIQKSSMAFHSQ